MYTKYATQKHATSGRNGIHREILLKTGEWRKTIHKIRKCTRRVNDAGSNIKLDINYNAPLE
jgi:hypothetical protein